MSNSVGKMRNKNFQHKGLSLEEILDVRQGVLHLQVSKLCKNSISTILVIFLFRKKKKKSDLEVFIHHVR